MININRRSKKQILLCIIFGILSSLLLVTGRTVYRTNSMHSLWDTSGHLAATLVSFLTLSLVCAAVFTALLYLSDKLTSICLQRTPVEKLPKWLFPALWLLNFVSRIPAFLAYYPGITSYDTYSQSRQALAGFYGMNKYHPPLHTIFWAVCIRAGRILGIDATVIYELIQMAALSLAFAAMLYYMIRRNYHPAVVLCSVLYTVLNPVIAIFSLEMVKDSVLSVFLILLSVRLAELSDAVWTRKCDANDLKCDTDTSGCDADVPAGEAGAVLPDGQTEPDAAFWLSLTSLAAVLCLLRNNAVYTVILFLPFAFLMARGYRLQILSSLAAALVIFGVVNGPVYHALGISEGNSREMLSVPIQQITTVVVQREDDLTEKDYEAIGHFLPYDKLAEDYNPRFADYAKNAFRTDYFDDHKREFAGLWLNLFGRFPEEYCSAFLSLNIQLWYPGSSAIDPYSGREYIETNIYASEYCSGERTGHFPLLLSFYESVAKYSPWMGLPVLSVLFALWTPLWLLAVCFFILAARSRLEKTLILFIPFFLWLTYMAGPVSCTRYMFPIMTLYPLILSVTIHAEAVD